MVLAVETWPDTSQEKISMKQTLSILTAVFAVLAFLISCGGSESSASCRVIGTVELIGRGTPSAVKIVLEDASNTNNSNVVYSNSDGKFVFEDIAPGSYYLNAYKEGFSLTWINVDGNVIHSNSGVKSFELVSGTTTNISVLMSNYEDYDDGEDSELKILDLDGNPATSIKIQNGSGSAGFQLYNGTGKDISWSVDSRNCVCMSEDGFDAVYFIDSIDPDKGVIKPGTSVPVVITINPIVYSYKVYDRPYLSIYAGLKHYELYLDF